MPAKIQYAQCQCESLYQWIVGACVGNYCGVMYCAVPENIHTLLTEGIGISWGLWGSARPKNLKKCMKINWNFLPWWGMDIFWKLLHIVCYIPVAFGAHSTQTSRPAWLKLLDRCFLIVVYWVMLSMDGRPSSRPFWAFFFLCNICIQAQKQRLEGYTYINKIILMFMEIGPPFALFQSKWGLCIQFKFC